MKKVAITGGLACGKSSVCRLLNDLGAYVASADKIVHHLLLTDSGIKKKVIDLLGADILENHQINRKKIAQKVFKDSSLLQRYEELLHPAVFEEIDRQYRRVAKEGIAPLFVVEVPLLFETDAQKGYDYTIAVVADPQTALQRYIHASGLSEEEYQSRMERQWSNERKAAQADFVITNVGDLAALRSQARNIFNQIVQSDLNNAYDR